VFWQMVLLFWRTACHDGLIGMGWLLPCVRLPMLFQGLWRRLLLRLHYAVATMHRYDLAGVRGCDQVP